MSDLVLSGLLVSLGLWAILAASAFRQSFGVGLLPVVLPYGALLVPALEVGLSGRDYLLTWEELQLRAGIDVGTPLLVDVLGPVVTGVFLAAAAEALLVGLRSPDRLGGIRGVLLLAYVGFWTTNVASPAVLGADGSFQHDYVYPLVLGTALLLQTPGDAAVFIRSTRNAVLLLVVVSLGVLAARPGMVLDPGYEAGLLPGVPRMAGLMPHAVIFGGLSLLGLLSLWAAPYRSRALTLAAAAVFVVGLLLAQSKLVWAALPLCAAPMIVLGRAPGARGIRGFRWRPLGSAAAAGGAALALVLLAGSFLSPIGGGALEDGSVLESARSLTGRTEIWGIAWDAWSEHPVFGYGTGLFGPEHRYAIQADYMTDAHNQFVDSAARAGLVGAVGLAFYLGVLAWAGVTTAAATTGLSPAVLTLLLLWSVTEVPFGLFGYGPMTLAQFALLASVTLGWSAAPAARPSRPGVPATPVGAP